MDTIMVEKVHSLAIHGQEQYDMLLLEKANKSVVLEQGIAFKHSLSFIIHKEGDKYAPVPG